jgi:hypothetical protein
MSDNTTPIEPFFELQREAITQTVSMMTGPRRKRRSMTEDSVAASRRAQEQTLELSRQAVHRLVGATEGLSPAGQTSDDVHDRIDEAFDQMAEHQATTLDSVEDLHQSVDETIGARTVAQAALLLRLNETLERQTVAATEQIEEELLQGESFGDDLEQALEELAEAVESGAVSIEDLDATLAESLLEFPLSGSGDEATGDASADAAQAPESDEAAHDVPADEVRCRVCDETFGAITYSHLQTHDMSIDEYTAEFEDAPLRPEDRE